MNIIEKYSLNSGLKIKKPEIYMKYFPMPIQKYIYFDPNNSINYKYWEEVFNLTGAILDQAKIDIVYVNYKSIQPMEINSKIINLAKFKINKNQHAYLIKNSLLYLGTPSFGMNIASMFDKKIVSIFGDTNLQNEYPYWSSKENVKILTPKSNEKPYYGTEAIDTRINSIYPEEIAYSILDLLDIKYEKSFKTLFIGNNFSSRTLEIIPEDISCFSSVGIKNPIIRMDYFFDEGILSEVLGLFESSIIFTDKSIDLNLINRYKNNISTIVYYIDEMHDVNFIKALKALGVKYSLVTKINLKDNPDIKLDYMELGLIKEIRKREMPIQSFAQNIFYKTNRVLIGKHGKFMTKFDWENNRFSGKLIVPENGSFWDEDLDNLLIYAVDKKI